MPDARTCFTVDMNQADFEPIVMSRGHLAARLSPKEPPAKRKQIYKRTDNGGGEDYFFPLSLSLASLW